MATYLLLRNNKEHGPLSLQHLIQMGLKPYDLIWVQGKSAAWRYSSEIPELKPYSPIVEEQPTNRVIKKPVEIKVTEEIIFPEEELKQPDFGKLKEELSFPVETTIKISGPMEKEEISFTSEISRQPEPLIQNARKKKDNWADIVFPDEVEKHPEELSQRPDFVEHEKYYPKKTVYVTMPRQLHIQKQEPVFNIHSSPVSNTHEEPIAMETKYSQPLDEIKEMYVKKLQDRKKQTAKKKFINASLKKAAILIGVIGIGVFIGLAIKPTGSEKIAFTNTDSLTSPATSTTISNEPVNKPATEINKEEKQSTNTNEEIKNTISDKKIVAVPVSAQKTVAEKNVDLSLEKQDAPVKKSSMPPKQKVSEEKDLPIAKETSPGVEITEKGERIKQTRGNNIFSETKEPNPVPVKSLNEFVTIKSNDYNIVAFGGIRNLQLTVNNDSKYALDNVLVEINYLKPNGLSLKEENIYFKSIAPNGSLTIRVPDTNRGMKVKYKILKVESKEFNSDMAGL
jgi:hypothetical protein